MVEAEALPSCGVLLSPRSTVVLPPPTSHAALSRISLTGLYQDFQRLWSSDRMRSPLFHCPLSQRSVPPTPRSSSGLHIQSLHPFHGLRLTLRGSALLCSPCGANLSTLQDSLYGTDRCFAPPSQRDTPLQHSQSPDCTGSLLRGSLAITTTGLSPVSKQCLSRHTNREGYDATIPLSL